MKLFFKFTLKSFHTCFHRYNMPTNNSIIVIFRTL